MKVWILALLCVFPVFYLASCTNQAEKKSEKSEVLFNKDKSFSVYYEYSENKSKIYVHFNQIKTIYCLQGDRSVSYSTSEEIIFPNQLVKNHILTEFNEKSEFFPYYDYSLKNGDDLIKKGYLTKLNKKDMLTIDLKEFQIDKSLGWEKPLYVTMTFFDCNEVDILYNNNKRPLISRTEYVVIVK
jgi:hypothetical protein